MIKKDGLFSTEGMTQSDRCIHTPSAFAKLNLLYVQEVGRLQSLKPHRCIREKLDSYLFMVVLEGSGSLDVGGKHYDMRTGSCALVDCMEHYEHISDEQDAWKLAWVHFNGHAARGYYELFIKSNGDRSVFCVNEVAPWDALIGELLTWQKERNLKAELYCGELLIQLLNRVLDSVLTAPVLESEQEKQIANEIREILNRRYAEKSLLQTIRETFGQEPKQLDEFFAKQYGIGIEEYIDNRRFNAAKEMLRFSIKPVEEIAKESGIGDLQAMQKMFYEKENMTAEEYRARWAAWIR